MKTHDKILLDISRLAHIMFRKNEGRVFLYGSHARGDASENSDWDLLIVTDDSISTDDDFKKYAFPFAEIGWKHGEQITPLHYTNSQWEMQKSTLFYQNVTKDAIRL